MRYLYDIMDISRQLEKLDNLHMYVKSLFLSLILMCEFLFISINMQTVFNE
jgi:hypothetical protein